MKRISLNATAPSSADEVFARISDAAALLTNHTTVQDDAETLLVESTETPWLLDFVLAPLFKRRNLIMVTVRDDSVRAVGNGSAAMVGFLEAYLLHEQRPAISAKLRELATG